MPAKAVVELRADGCNAEIIQTQGEVWDEADRTGRAETRSRGDQRASSCLSGAWRKGVWYRRRPAALEAHVSCPGLHSRSDGTPLMRLICWG